MNILEALDGKKAYLVAFGVATLGLLNAFGIHEPQWVDLILGAFGIVAAKSAVAKLEP